MLSFPETAGLRPTLGRTRETLFNWLRPELAGADCLDLFAGSGALGFEAASNGAHSVTFVESVERPQSAFCKYPATQCWKLPRCKQPR